MNNIAMAIHGGASSSSAYLRKNLKEYEKGLNDAILSGYKILKRGGSSLDAVEVSVKHLEDNPLFNAGRGSALNCQGEVEMDASIMDGRSLKAGAVAMVRSVKNPVSLARNVMTKTKHVFLSGYGALDFAKTREICLEPDAYFITDYQYKEFLKTNKYDTLEKILEKKIHGTVGAVALDRKGNLAAATSTGGTTNCLPGRIGDSCIIGAGCYANNKSCAVSGTGSGEILITHVVAHNIAMLLKLKKYPLQKSCDYVISRAKHPKDQGIGVISVDPKGNVGISFNTQIMKRAWITPKGELFIKIYK
jgi:L-asparaginase / beta-aspartyl-peptidase